MRNNRNKEAKGEDRIKGLGPKKERRKEVKKLRRKVKQRQDKGPVSLQPFFRAAES